MNNFKHLHKQYSNNIAFITDIGESLTYSDLHSFSIQIKSYVTERSLVFSLCTNSLGSVCGYYAFISNETVPLLLDASIDKELLTDLIRAYEPNYLWIPNELTHIFPNSIVSFSKYGYSLVIWNETKVKLFSQLGLLLTTSGSTGSPKLVRLSYENIFSNAISIATYLKINKEERPITSLPMHYTYGLSVINSHLISGSTILLTDKSITQKEFWNFAKNEMASSFAGVPYTYEMLRKLRFFRMNLPHLKTLTQAGGKLSADLVKEYVENSIEKGIKFIVMYGQVEATARMSYLPFNFATTKYASIGIAIPGGSFKIFDYKNVEINEPNIDGELVYYGKNVSLGSALNKDDLKKSDFNNGILHTGDIARRDTDGFFYITGRKNRFIKIYGNRVNLDNAEQIIKTITTDCACVGVDDHMTIYVTDESITNEVLNLISSKTGLNKIAFFVKTVREIPKNSSGKIQYSLLETK